MFSSVLQFFLIISALSWVTIISNFDFSDFLLISCCPSDCNRFWKAMGSGNDMECKQKTQNSIKIDKNVLSFEHKYIYILNSVTWIFTFHFFFIQKHFITQKNSKKHFYWLQINNSKIYNIFYKKLIAWTEKHAENNSQ